MKKVFKILGILLLVVALLAGVAVTYITQALPDIPVQADLKVEITPERVARGEYLANHSGVEQSRAECGVFLAGGATGTAVVILPGYVSPRARRELRRLERDE